MTRSDREELNRKLAQARRLAMEPTDPLTRERLAELIEELGISARSLRFLFDAFLHANRLPIRLQSP
jgi:hypothetical protein